MMTMVWSQLDRCEIYEGWRWEGGTARDHPEIFSQMPKPSNSQTIDRRMDNDDAYGASNAKQTPSNISDFLSHTESTARRAIAIVLRASGPLMKGGYYSVVVYYETPQRFSPRCWPPSGSEDLGYGADHSDLQTCSRYGINHKSFFYQLLLWKQAIQLKQKQKLEYWTLTHCRWQVKTLPKISGNIGLPLSEDFKNEQGPCYRVESGIKKCRLSF